MSKRTNTMAAHLTVFSLLAIMLPFQAFSKEVTDVKVVNFPDTQKIRGSVWLEGTTKAVKREGVLLSPARRNELGELVQIGQVDTDGYTSVSLFVQGEVKSVTFLSGSIGLMMIPDEEPILRALKEAKQVQFPIETACSIKSGDSEFFSCELANLNIGFPRYRIYLYNTLDKSAEVNAYLYLKK